MSGELQKLHPCQSCGACCGHFRVGFHYLQSGPGGVPEELTVDLDQQRKAMKGTERKHNPRCVALQGEIGTLVSCTIYEVRPTPCRYFKASYEDGEQNYRCDEARAKYGLPPLNKKDWIK